VTDAGIVKRNIESLEFRDDALGGLGFLKGKLRVLVEPPAQRNQACEQRLANVR
jgi:hypothetical protein